MTALQQAIYSTLAGFAGLNALVGPRIFPGAAPQGAGRPYCVVEEVSDVNVMDLGGSYETSGMKNARVQVTAWAGGENGATVAREIDKQVRLAMQQASGFKSTLADGRSLGRETETKLYGYQSDFSVWLRT